MLTFLLLGYGFLLPLLCAVVLCRVLRRRLSWLKSRERKVGKERIHRLFPRPRRPLSGGLAILVSFSLGIVALNFMVNRPPQSLAWPFLGLVWFFGLIGLVDDFRKVGGRGLAEREKLLLQAAAGLGFAFLLQHQWGFGLIHLPFLAPDQTADIGPLYPLLGMLVIVAASNAVNLTDGLDGLAAGQVAIAAFFLLGMCGLLGKPLTVGIFLSLLGACGGFLIFNYPPARLLMGDMGSLSLGAALGGGAMLAGVEVFLPVAGAIFVVNTLSVILQIGTVRWLWRLLRLPRQRTTEPFRPFLCTPLHHHFQWLGWSEKAILRLFWVLGAGFGGLALIGLTRGEAWALGMVLIPLPLVMAAGQKLLCGSYFIGLVETGESGARLALFQGVPLEVVGKRLYRLVRETTLGESTLLPGAAEGLLWRPMSEIEARVALGSLFMQQHLGEKALAEWEEIPIRNLLLREGVVLQLARLYYSRDELLEAIRLWEALPRTRLVSMPNLQEIIRAARLRLAELAFKSCRQCLNTFSRARAGEAVDLADLSRQLALSRRFNGDLLALLASASGGGDEARGPEGPAAAAFSYRRAEKALQERIRALERALGWCERAQREGHTAAEAGLAGESQISHLRSHISEWLGFSAEEVEGVMGEALEAKGEIVSFQPTAKASRNAIARLGLRWTPPWAGPPRLVAKSYRRERVAFFSACYRREKALLEMLHDYGCPVPRPCGGTAREDRALLLMEDGGTETLAERLEGLEAAGRQHLLAAAIDALACLHRRALLHLSDLQGEVRRIDKETLSSQYHLNAFRIALERLTSIAAEPDESGGESEVGEAEMAELLHHYQPVAELLASRPETFIHFEFTPHHLLLDRERLTIFDFEQATIGPAEFDVACLLNSPEADLSPEACRSLVESYEKATATRLDWQALDYANLAKSLTYAGAALNFYHKFGGNYHLQRMEWYLRHSLYSLGRHFPLRSLRRLLGPWLEKAREKGHSLAAPAGADFSGESPHEASPAAGPAQLEEVSREDCG